MISDFKPIKLELENVQSMLWNLNLEYKPPCGIKFGKNAKDRVLKTHVFQKKKKKLTNWHMVHWHMVYSKKKKIII
jgi:hypothetical protein